ncbi:hypothetical protein QQS21_006003 [Conoideocrella luteorostrata]|uniref:Uncharacterized protein n=1 Tax=Conoideocrella luteorostrata TaxID=1105319 RepID=A0AAJ0CQT6_9HYPO|nr:hypothetical protein QQS21_006003 [Conoideocrella luteorostrata]
MKLCIFAITAIPLKAGLATVVVGASVAINPVSKCTVYADAGCRGLRQTGTGCITGAFKSLACNAQGPSQHIMQLYRYLFAAISIFALLGNGGHVEKFQRSHGEENYQVLKRALRGKKIFLTRTYALYEFWTISGQPAVMKHFTHNALVVGIVVDTENGTEFLAERFHMSKDHEGSSGSVHGDVTKAARNKNWWANHYRDGEQWRKTRPKNMYRLAGYVGDYSGDAIQTFGKFLENPAIPS